VSASNIPHYFLTGGTGGLGAELIPRLLDAQPQACITALVRANDMAHAKLRMELVFRYVRHYHPGFDASRVEAVVGDVTYPTLGLSPRAAASLRASVTHIVHSAASIELQGSREELRRINLGGTRAVAEFAQSCPQLQRLLLLSTAFVAGRRSGRILESELDCGQRFVNHYEASKFASELYLRSLADRLPTTIVRPSIVVGDSQDGHVLAFQNMYVPLYFLGTGAVSNPPGEHDTVLDIVPVDHVAEVVVRTLHHPACEGGTYHACSDEASLLPFTELQQASRDVLAKRRVLMLQRGSRLGSSSAALTARLGAFFDYLACPKRFSSGALMRDLGEHAPAAPVVAEFLPRLMRFWQQAEFGRRMPWQPASTHAPQALPPSKIVRPC
jgi:thioester reductase-like protein